MVVASLHDAAVLSCEVSAYSLLLCLVSFFNGIFECIFLLMLPAELASSVECFDLFLDGA